MRWPGRFTRSTTYGEYRQQRAGLTMNQADGRVRGDVDGETAAALVHARGAKTHVFEEFGCLSDTCGGT